MPALNPRRPSWCQVPGVINSHARVKSPDPTIAASIIVACHRPLAVGPRELPLLHTGSLSVTSLFTSYGLKRKVRKLLKPIVEDLAAVYRWRVGIWFGTSARRALTNEGITCPRRLSDFLVVVPTSGDPLGFYCLNLDWAFARGKSNTATCLII